MSKRLSVEGFLMRSRKRFTLFVLFLLCTTMMIPFTASAAYYNTYTTVATIGNANSCTAMQGFAVGSTYCYSAKVNSANSSAVIYRTNMSDGTTTLMTNGEDGTTYCTYLGHANDMTVTSINSVNTLFIATMSTGSLSLVKVQYSGTTYNKVGNFTIKYNGTDKAMSAVKIISKDTSTINFLFKSGASFYTGSIDLTANSGTINVTDAFTINTADALVNGSKVSNISSYVFQGFGYSSAANRIYVPMTYQNVSIILVYDNISTASGTIYANNNLSFRITSSAYPDLFEIESCGVNDGQLWFNCNRRTEPGDTAHDAVCYFDGYTE